jgi:hypothetical protein
MYVRWQARKRRRSQFGRWQDSDIHWSAVAVENKRVSGKPTQRHVCYIIGFTESAAKIASQQCHLWDHISERLDRLGNQITAANREQIEVAIAKKLPRPTPAQYKDIARNSAQSLGWEWISNKQRAALQDEAERWKNTKGNFAEKIKRAQALVMQSQPAIPQNDAEAGHEHGLEP